MALGTFSYYLKLFAVLRRALYVALGSSTGSITVNMMSHFFFL